jgi:hypothetical protein
MNPVTLLASTAYKATLQALNADGSVNTSAVISNPTLTFSATSGTFSSAQPALESGSTFTFTTDGVDTTRLCSPALLRSLCRVIRLSR